MMSLALFGRDVVFEEVQVLGIQRPENMLATGSLQPEREVKIPVVRSAYANPVSRPVFRIATMEATEPSWLEAASYAPGGE